MLFLVAHVKHEGGKSDHYKYFMNEATKAV
jgi:hypothetical protein